MSTCLEHFQRVSRRHLLEKEFRRERVYEKAESAQGLKFKRPIPRCRQMPRDIY
jgi:hypothetical protein